MNVSKLAVGTANVIALSIAISLSDATAESRMEDPSFAVGMATIIDTHVLNSLGLPGEFIGIYVAVSEASKAAGILYTGKWRPGDDDLSWVDNPKRNQADDPFKNFSLSEKRSIRKRLRHISYLASLPRSADQASAIQDQLVELRRTLAGRHGGLEALMGWKIVGAWTYMEKGACQIGVDRGKVGIKCNWTPNTKTARPHYTFSDATVDGNRLIDGHWKCAKGGGKVCSEGTQRMQEAVITNDGSEIRFTLIEDKDGVGWQGVTLRRKN